MFKLLFAVFMLFAVAAAEPKPQILSSVYPSVYSGVHSGVYSGLPLVRSVAPVVSSSYVAASPYAYSSTYSSAYHPSAYRTYGSVYPAYL